MLQIPKVQDWPRFFQVLIYKKYTDQINYYLHDKIFIRFVTINVQELDKFIVLKQTDKQTKYTHRQEKKLLETLLSTLSKSHLFIKHNKFTP